MQMQPLWLPLQLSFDTSPWGQREDAKRTSPNRDVVYGVRVQGEAWGSRRLLSPVCLVFHDHDKPQNVTAALLPPAVDGVLRNVLRALL